MEKDDEMKGPENSYDFGARMLDPRYGRWLSVDPLAAKYPSLSPFNFTGNNPIMFIDPDGEKIVWGEVTREYKQIIKSAISSTLLK
jgi:RHS repeat-associated protein